MVVSGRSNRCWWGYILLVPQGVVCVKNDWPHWNDVTPDSHSSDPGLYSAFVCLNLFPGNSVSCYKMNCSFPVLCAERVLHFVGSTQNCAKLHLPINSQNLISWIMHFISIITVGCAAKSTSLSSLWQLLTCKTGEGTVKLYSCYSRSKGGWVLSSCVLT